MLYKWLYELAEGFSAFNVFRYITFRTFLAFFTGFFVCWFVGPRFIRRLVQKQIGQNIRPEGPPSHIKKAKTPTMGGGLILLSLLIPSFLWIDILQPFVLAVLVITLSFAGLGYWDDSLKVKHKNSKGLSGKVRLGIEFLVSVVTILVLIHLGHLTSIVHVPFLKSVSFDLGFFYVIFGSLVIVGCANAVNLTDGLDGLAIVPVMICAGTLSIFSYVAGHYEIADYLAIPFISGVGELTPLCAAVVAAGLGFLWFNTYPAQVFMGDIGSLSLGGFLGAMAVLTKNELLLLILGGVFVVEALSVIAQVTSFKLTGKRVLNMAPLHHHFELKGLEENKIIVRFWIISILLAVLSLSTLKLR